MQYKITSTQTEPKKNLIHDMEYGQWGVGYLANCDPSSCDPSLFLVMGMIVIRISGQEKFVLSSSLEAAKKDYFVERILPLGTKIELTL